MSTRVVCLLCLVTDKFRSSGTRWPVRTWAGAQQVGSLMPRGFRGGQVKHG